MKNIKICDRTLNNGLHAFEPEVKAEIYRQLQKAGIDWIDCDDELSPINCIRTNADYAISELIAHGTNVIFEPENLSLMDDREVLDLFEQVAEVYPFGFTLAGYWNFDDVNNMQRIALLADKHLPKEVALGLKPIDHLQMTMSLALKFIELPITRRQLYLESSLVGFGEGGLLHTEVLAKLMNKDMPEVRYKLDDIPAVIVKHIAPRAGQYHWGYGISNLMQLEAIKAESKGVFET